jgi:hypothetical protein
VLPFTGFPVWAAVLVGLTLLAAGLELRRRFRRRGESASVVEGLLATPARTSPGDVTAPHSR